MNHYYHHPTSHYPLFYTASPEECYTKNNGNKPHIIWQVRQNGNPKARTVSVIARDCPDIFSKIVGAFTLNGFDIAGAQSYRQNESTFDTFDIQTVADREFKDESLELAKKDLNAAVRGELNLSAAFRRKSPVPNIFTGMIPSRQLNYVHVDNASSVVYSIIEVRTYDFPGLLFGLTEAIFRCGLNIWKADINTKGSRVHDMFHVRDFAGKKADTSGKVLEIKSVIKSVLPGV